MKRLITGAAAAALSLAIAGSANAAVFAFSSNPGGLQGNGSANDTYTLTVSGLTVTVKGFGSLGTSVNLGDQDDVTFSNGNGLGVEGNDSNAINSDDGDGEGLLLDFGKVVNLTQAQFAQWGNGDDADYRYSTNPLNSGSLDDIGGLSVSNGVATWNTNLVGRYFFFAAIDEGTRQSNDSDENFWLKSVTASAVGSAVPEPATWAMMIMGFGLAGSQIRRAVREQKRTRSVAL